MKTPTAIGLLGISFVLALLGSRSEICAQDPTPPPPAPAPAGVDPEARLIEGELLELAEGKLDEAVEIYRALLERGDLAPALRARTLFASARAHRKRGELGAAKERAEELIALPGAPAELVEAARRTRDDLAAGAERLPPFDWVAEVEQNPQIQAQIFEWGMQLVGGSEDARKVGDVAAGKLLALGSTVIPTLEEMLARSGSAEHRAALADVLVRLGVLRHIPHLLIASSPGRSRAYWALRNIPAASRPEAVRVLGDLPDNADSRFFAARGRLWLGSVDRIDEDIRTILGPIGAGKDNSRLPMDFELFPESAPAYRDRLPLIAELSFPEYESTLGALLAQAPEILRREDLEPLRARKDGYTKILLEPLFQTRREDFLWLFEGPSAQQLLSLIPEPQSGSNPALTRREWKATLDSLPPPRRARVLRATLSHGELLALATAEPDAVPEFAAFLAEDPQPFMDTSKGREPWLNWASAPFRETQRPVRRPRGGDYPSASPSPPPAVSPALEEAMERVFLSSSESWRRGIALELIVRAYPNSRRESFALLRDLLADPAADPLERLAALTGVLLRLPDHETERDATIELAESYCAKVGEPEWLLNVGQEVENERFSVRIGSEPMWVKSDPDVAGELIVNFVRSLDSDYSQKYQIERLGIGLMPSIAAGRGIDLYRRIQFHVHAHRGVTSLGALAFDKLLAGWAEGFDDSARLRPLADLIFGISSKVSPAPTRAWSKLLVDPTVSPDLRAQFLNSIIQDQSDPSRETFIREFDWSTLILADDPLADLLTNWHLLPGRSDRALRLAARASPRPVVRRWGWSGAPLQATPEELEPAIGSDDKELRSIGYSLLLQADDTRWLPLLHRAVRDTSNEYREQAIDRLAFFADESSLPILTALLDDPVFAVRAKALEALEKIEETLSQQEKWRERFGEKKGKRKQ